jgi:hypothetical protein
VCFFHKKDGHFYRYFLLASKQLRGSKISNCDGEELEGNGKNRLDYVCNWLRSIWIQSTDIWDYPTVVALAGFESSIELHPNEKERIMKDSIDWLKVNDPTANDISDSTFEVVLSVASVPLPADRLNSAEKEKCMKYVILFL